MSDDLDRAIKKLDSVFSNVVHGRANHDPISAAPMCLCGKAGILDKKWNRFYCPDSGKWLEGLYTECWCKSCKPND